MALVLDATVAGENANSYITAADADTYYEGRLFASDWTGASDSTKEAALVWATRMLDYSFDWTGSKYTLEQALRWPRFGALDRDGQLFDSNEIPTELQYAVSELARLLITEDRAAEPGTMGLEKLKVDVIELTFDKLDRAATVPDEIYQMISHLGKLNISASGGGQVHAATLIRT